MKRSLFSLLLILSWGCSRNADTIPVESSRIIVQDSKVRELVIEDFNWEIHLTKTYTIDLTGITITDNSISPVDRRIEFTPEQATEIWRLIKDIKTIYVGNYRVEEMKDGVFVSFHFNMDNGVTLTTHVNNIRIEDYAKLTQAITDIVSPSEPNSLHAIHYHQYDYLKPMPVDE